MSPRHLMLALAAMTVAQSPAMAAVPTGADVLAHACASIPGGALDRRRIANAILAKMGRYAYEVSPNDPSLFDEFALVFAGNVETISFGELGADFAPSLRQAILGVEAVLDGAPPPGSSNVPVLAGPLPAPDRPAAGGWLFGATEWVFTCSGKQPALDRDLATEFEKADAPPRFAIRRTVEELGKTGADIKSAGTFGIGIKRTRTRLDDGSTKTATNLTVDGTVGIRLSKEEAFSPSFAYASYSLARARTRPAAALAPGAKPSDADTNALELGLTGRTGLLDWGAEGQNMLWLQGNASVIRNFAKDSSIARLRLNFEPVFSLQSLFGNEVGPCDLGKYVWLDKEGRFFGRCSLTLQVEGSHVLDKGSAVLGAKDEFVAIGPKIGYTLFAPTFARDGKKDGVIATIDWRRLWRVHGDLPAIDRLDAKLAYRLWTSGGLGFDIGVTYAKGTNDKSYTKEDILDFGIGLVF